jgi:hypothetical protein
MTSAHPRTGWVWLNLAMSPQIVAPCSLNVLPNASPEFTQK